jgi:flagellar hook-length control protein FliK
VNANPVLAAVGTGPPGQPPPDASAITVDGPPFASLMAQALEQQSNGKGAASGDVPLVEGGVEGIDVSSLLVGALSPAVVLVTPQPPSPFLDAAGIEGTSTGPDRSAEVIEDESSPEEATEVVLAVTPALVPWATLPPQVPTAEARLGLPGNESTTGPMLAAPIEAATAFLDSDTHTPAAGPSSASEARPGAMSAFEAAPIPVGSDGRVGDASAELAPGTGPTSPVNDRASGDLGSGLDDESSSGATHEDTTAGTAVSRETSLPEAAGMDLSAAELGSVPERTSATMSTAAAPSITSGPAAAAPAASMAQEMLDTTQPASMPPALADSVASAVRVGQDELRLVLNPPDLGQLDVRIVETPEGLRVSLHASTREASELIQQQLPMLQTALESRDLRVERLEVRTDLGGGLDQPGERGGRQGNPDPEQTPEWSSVASTSRASAAPSTPGHLGRPGGRLDLVA